MGAKRSQSNPFPSLIYGLRDEEQSHHFFAGQYYREFKGMRHASDLFDRRWGISGFNLPSTEDAPALYQWDRTGAHPEAPARDAYALRLVVGRSLYDDGRLVSETPLLQRLVPEQGLRVHPSDLAANLVKPSRSL